MGQMNELCKCGNPATQKHHKFPQARWARRLYGNLLDDDRNIEPMCADCHISHAKVSIWRETDFCKELGIKMRSKEERFKELRRI